MSYRLLKLLTIFLPPLIIGGFEYIRHEFLSHLFTMETGNLIITLLALGISYLFTIWMFRSIEHKNQQLAEEQARGAVYQERERIARELHDNIAQILFFLNVKMKKGKIDEASAAISEIDTHLRQAIFNLRSSPEEGVSFTDRLTKWLNEWSVIASINLSKDIQVPDKYFSIGEEVQLFAIIQEALTNISKHSQANRAKISFHAFPDRWIVEINDDGIGFSNYEMNINKYGISLMQKRANELNATFSIITQNIGGTILRLSSGSRI